MWPENMMAWAWGCSKAPWDFQRNRKREKQVRGAERTQVNTTEKGRVQSKVRARDRARMERKIQKMSTSLAWSYWVGRQNTGGRAKGNRQKKKKQKKQTSNSGVWMRHPHVGGKGNPRGGHKAAR